MSAQDIQSQTLRNSPYEWRVLSGGSGPTLLFLHGAGASAASFQLLLSKLAVTCHVVAPDLPGHGATRLGARGRSGLEAMAEDIASLMTQRFESPFVIVGHSAGGAIALRLSKILSPRGLVLINPALDPFSGVAGWAFPALARGLSVAPFSGDVLAGLFGRERRISELLEATGSAVTQEMKARYLALAQNPQHIRGTLAMMAAWDVGALRAQLPDYDCPASFLIADGDTTVLPSAAAAAAKEMPSAQIATLAGGHLIHEENPELVSGLIAKFVVSLGATRA